MIRQFVTEVAVVGAKGAGQDRAAVREGDDGVVIVLADGAGGTANGAAAAQAVVDGVLASADAAWSRALERVEDNVARTGGQATAVVVSVTRDGIVGASVGDSGAWVVRGDEVEDLTADQVRKPLVGAGADPVELRRGPLGSGTLVVASDGLWTYAKLADIVRIARGDDLHAVATALVDLVRLPSGALQDDVVVVLCRDSTAG